MKILVAEPIAEAGVDLLRAPGWDVVVSNAKDYLSHLADSDALIVRSAVKVNADLLAKAPHLRVVGRAGVGVDNVDLDAATRAGVLVMNTPGGNAVAVAEHTLGLMISMARSIPQAVASTKSGKWEKKRFMGSELRGKTLGIIGLGSVGREVVRRARAFEMRVITSDRHVNRRVAEDLGVTVLGETEFYAQSDYISLHAALTPETRHLLDESAFARMKTGVRIVNCARGEMIDGEALQREIASGKVGGAALDVFETEPPQAGDPLIGLDQVLATPHIAGSTREAQESVGIRIAEQVLQYLRDGIAMHALNVPELTVDQYRTSVPLAALAERMGTFLARISNGVPSQLRFTYRGRLAGQNTSLIRSAGLAGLLNDSGRRVNVVNALQSAEEAGVRSSEFHDSHPGQMDSLKLELEGGGNTISAEGALVLGKPRLLEVDGIPCEVPLMGHLLFLRNQDVPGVIGYVGTIAGENNINIGYFSLGRPDVQRGGASVQAIALIETDEPVPENVLKQLRDNSAVKMAKTIEFTG